MSRNVDLNAGSCPNCGLPDASIFADLPEADCACKSGGAKGDQARMRSDSENRIDVYEKNHVDVDDLRSRSTDAEDEDEHEEDYGEFHDADDNDDLDDVVDDDDVDDLEDMLDEEDDFADDDEDDDEDDEDDDENEDDEDDLNDFLDEDDLDDDMLEEFDEVEASASDADEFEDDLLENDHEDEDEDYDGFLDGAEDYEDAFDDMDRRVLSSPCAGIKKIVVRKNRAGDEPLTTAQRNQICAAIQQARRWAARAERVLNGIWRQRRRRRSRRRDAWRRNAAVVRWFGRDSLSNRQIRLTRRRVRRIRNFLQRGLKVVVVQHNGGKRSYSCGARTNAFHPLSGQRVYLCPQFLANNPALQARIIVHELVHRLGWSHARLRGFGAVSSTRDHSREARELARRFPRRARRNPVNIAWFFSEV